jgi:hypothetical protein
MLSLRIVGAPGSSASFIPASLFSRSMSSRIVSGFTRSAATLLFAMDAFCQSNRDPASEEAVEFRWTTSSPAVQRRDFARTRP